MDNCWKSQQQENRIREKLFRNNFSWKSDRTSASAFRLCRQCWREENSASMGNCRIFQKIEPPSSREAKSWSVSTFRLRVAHNFPVRYGQFRRQALTEENEDNSQQPEQLPTICWTKLWITAEKVNNRKIESGKSCSGTTFPENQIGHQLQHSGSAGKAEERKIPPAWVTDGFFKR